MAAQLNATDSSDTDAVVDRLRRSREPHSETTVSLSNADVAPRSRPPTPAVSRRRSRSSPASAASTTRRRSRAFGRSSQPARSRPVHRRYAPLVSGYIAALSPACHSLWKTASTVFFFFLLTADRTWRPPRSPRLGGLGFEACASPALAIARCATGYVAGDDAGDVQPTDGAAQTDRAGIEMTVLRARALCRNGRPEPAVLLWTARCARRRSSAMTLPTCYD